MRVRRFRIRSLLFFFVGEGSHDLAELDERSAELLAGAFDEGGEGGGEFVGVGVVEKGGTPGFELGSSFFDAIEQGFLMLDVFGG